MFKQIHDICFFGQGGYDWYTIYNLPISHRLFIFHEINEYNKKQNEKPDGRNDLLNPSAELKQAASKYKNSPSYNIPKRK